MGNRCLTVEVGAVKAGGWRIGADDWVDVAVVAVVVAASVVEGGEAGGERGMRSALDLRECLALTACAKASVAGEWSVP